jgi:4-amino-4-deoxy-L-arabinose transferase-like glycosyltransferase
MSETKTDGTATTSPHPAKPFPLGLTRRGLSIGGVALVAINLVLLVSGGSGSSLLPAVLWGGAAVCFLGAFVLFLLEPAPRGEQAPLLRVKALAETSGPGGAERPAGEATAKADEPTVPRPEGPRLEGPATKPEEDVGRSPEGNGADAGAESAKADADKDKAASAPSKPDKSANKLLRRGNPLRWTRGGVTAAVSSFVAFLLMAHPGQWRIGVPLGALFVAIASWGLMDLMGTFDDPDDRVAKSQTFAELWRPLVAFGASVVLFVGALGFAHAGRGLPQIGWGVVVTGTFVLGVATFFGLGRQLGAWATDEEGIDRPFWRRHGFWLVVLAAVLYFPCMGSYALWDPWETHYGEVSREILAKDDWISLWWAQDGWFWSKPVLDMWMQAIFMATLGVHYQPDKMLVGDAAKPLLHPEWAVRAPVVLLTIVALYLLYKGVAKVFGRRAAFLGGLVLATMPDWYFIAHQTMTDMPFVGAMTACMGLVLLGLRTAEDREVRAYEVRIGRARWRLSAWHLVFGTIVACALPQILYLLSRNFELVWRPGAHGFRPHWDEFWSGSGGGNCGLPGNEECKLTTPASVPHSVANPESFGAAAWRVVAGFEPALQGLLWAGVVAAVLYMNWGERRSRRLYYLAAWFFAALSTLGKGPAGFGLPMLITFAYLCASRPGEEIYSRILRIIRELTEFEIVGGLLVVLAVALPWYVAMYVRHGSPFTDRLIFHDMFNRAFHHVHDTNEGDDTSFRFYVWQLGYALFPWTGLAPLGLLWWLRRGTSQQDNDRADASVLLCMWFVFGFALFSFMGTKFHHYIFPAVPPVAMLVGVVLDDMLGERPIARDVSRVAAYAVGLGLGVGLMTLGIARALPGSFFGTKPDYKLPDASIPMAVLLLVLGAAVVGGVAWAFRARPSADLAPKADGAAGVADAPPSPSDEETATQAHASRMLAAGAVAGALLLVLVVRDLVIKPDSADQPGAIRLLQLFTYNYRRQWPESLDFGAALAGFGVMAVLVSFALASRAIRRQAVIAMCGLGVVWGLWGLDVYMEKTAQHWGQHEVIEAYYADRASPDEILVAYQMNWKGENFYTGNHIPAFVSTGSTFTTWMKKKRDEGAKVMYFVTEHGRIGGLKGEVGAKNYREVTDKALCNKFVLVRAEL